MQALERTCRDIGHRVASLALLVMVAALAAIVANRGALGDMAQVSAPRRIYGLLLAGTFLLSDMSLLAGFASWFIRTNARQSPREPAGLMCISLILMMLSLTLFALAKMQRLDIVVDHFVKTTVG